MGFSVKKAAVLGAGVMGAAIAAHLANVGIPVLLLDILPKELTEEEKKKGLTLSSWQVRNRFALKGLETAKKSKPAAFYTTEDSHLVEVGNLTDHLERLKECDWVIEAVIENLAIKKQVLQSVAQVVGDETIVSTNTSGISIAAMSSDCPLSFRQRFLGTHFFNPPRYMKLLEIIPGPDTLPEVVTYMTEFGSRVLGKGVVLAKDTPNFIANRIGTYGLIATLQAMEKFGFGVDEVDAVTGPVLGRPKSATFRTLDLVGLDTFVHVAKNVQESVSNEQEKAAFALPDYILNMVEKGWIGEKSGQGFFKREKTSTGKEIFALDLHTLEYRPRKKVKSSSFEVARSAKTLPEKIRALAYGKDQVSLFVWEILKRVLLYTAERQEEIADSILAVDEAMKWGFNWELGPYETWDILGLKESVERMRSEGERIPEFVEQLLKSGCTSFYQQEASQNNRFYVGNGEYRQIEEQPEQISLQKLKLQGKLIKKNTGASLVDIGDGIVCLEFHSLKQAIGTDVTQMIRFATQEVERNWDGLVIGNEAPNFCVGANLMMMLMEAQDENWDDLNLAVHEFQQTLYQLKYLPKPVVAAPFALALGGGAEVCFPADRVQASAETYMGLVEVGVGLIPGGGGNKELLIRAIENVPQQLGDRLDNYVRTVFETIALARVSTSAKEARKLGFLRQTDGISVNRDYLLHDAKVIARSMADAGYQPRQERPIPVVGQAGAALLRTGVYGMKWAGQISDHDAKIADKLIHVLTGGDLPRGTLVSEQYLLDLEREAFLSLIGEPKTQARMQHMLQTGKPLRN
ncbi:3-hydroxyacyl-CoA dehydrogenase/enoyl-CoA hydratase family protein [Alicyclobacillus tolerans]|uniref:3-hydroxyacyl-CoA dehydrogenase n=2 Tax=Alicyclobacillus tolerans TaxID=90970 RepID=A0A1M6L8G7_9BACL|nr:MULTISPECIES: 3-hydroxyacyl-CoA dehydrogenase/enoyl-CoA hydratase family protein [Alicyclobacillus]MDP9727542.1 3-hydroxyacyl-CoA dehydrogenase [Alicyclobacillus tengchongensis]SHJ67473.1 3-hydroxyacyl-CoA dehydrogenase [Alicyclobacillus montanus]